MREIKRFSHDIQYKAHISKTQLFKQIALEKKIAQVEIDDISEVKKKKNNDNNCCQFFQRKKPISSAKLSFFARFREIFLKKKIYNRDAIDTKPRRKFIAASHYIFALPCFLYLKFT